MSTIKKTYLNVFLDFNKCSWLWNDNV